MVHTCILNSPYGYITIRCVNGIHEKMSQISFFFELKQLIVTVGVYFLFVFLAFRYTQDKFLWLVRLVYGTKYRASIQKLYSFSAMAIIINWWHRHTHTQFLCFILFFHSVMFVKCQFGLMPLFMCAILCRGWNTRQLKKC